MDFLPKDIEDYATKYTNGESGVLAELNRETYAKTLMPRMLSGHIQGQVLRMLSQMIKPKNVLEIGTFTGYSAICMSDGLQEGGKIYTLDINEELETMVRKYLGKAGLEDKVDYRIGNALDIIPTLDVKFDLVFIDADKDNYSNYFDLVIDKVNTGGYIIADNVLWSGKVTMPREEMDVDTAALVDYCEKINADDRVENVLLPVRDGLLIARKK